MGHSIPPADDPLRTSSADSPPESVGGSVTRWLGGLKAGEVQAFQPLWNRYFELIPLLAGYVNQEGCPLILLSSDLNSGFETRYFVA